MKKFRSLGILAIFAFIVTACAAGRSLEALQSEWVGRSFDDLVFAWGPPTLTTPLEDGRKVSRFSAQPQVFSVNGIAGTAFCEIDIFVGANNAIVRMALNGSGVNDLGCTRYLDELEDR